MFDDRGIVQRRNDRSGPLQRQETKRVWVDLAVAFPYRRPRTTPTLEGRRPLRSRAR